jgi:membrane-associated phospholipid phosphatase
LAVPLLGGMTREWGWLFGLALVDLLWCWRIGMSFSQLGPQLFVVTGLALVCAFYRYSGRSVRIADACEVAALWIGFSIAGCILTYLCATWSFTPYDAAFDRLDSWLGFDWLRWKQFVDAHRFVHWLLAIAYASFMPQLLISILYFAFTGRQPRNRVLFRAAFIALVISATISGLLPAVSAFSFYGMAAQAPYLHDLLLLRGDHVLAFSVPALQGIITMPSYHAVLGVLVAYSFRRTGLIGVTIGLWNLLMLISVLSEGGHYLVDVIVGLGVAAVALWLAQATLSKAGEAAVSAPAGARGP